MNIDKLKPEEVNAVIARWDAQTDTLRGWSSPAAWEEGGVVFYGVVAHANWEDELHLDLRQACRSIQFAQTVGATLMKIKTSELIGLRLCSVI